jgi:hypothetical protein
MFHAQAYPYLIAHLSACVAAGRRRWVCGEPNFTSFRDDSFPGICARELENVAAPRLLTSVDDDDLRGRLCDASSVVNHFQDCGPDPVVAKKRRHTGYLLRRIQRRGGSARVADVAV